MKKWFLTVSIVFSLVLGACNQSNVSEKITESIIEEKGTESTVTKEDEKELRKKAYMNLKEIGELIKNNNLVNGEKKLLEDDLLNDELLIKGSSIEVDLNAVKSYIAFHKSDDPISLRAAKLMDEVDYEYSGVLDIEIEQAIYSPQEEGSLISDTYANSGRSSYDYLDWKYNDSKTAYEKAKNYKELAVRVVIEKAEKENLIEQAKGQNPHIGMTKEEVEASLWGLPEKINRTVTQYRTSEQWVYGNGQYLYFTDGILTSFQD